MTWLINGRVLDIQTGIFESRNVRIEKGRFGELSASFAKAPGGSVLDLEGAFVLPGFFDCHIHLCIDTHSGNISQTWANTLPGTVALYAAQAARRLIMAGITTARDCGGWDYHEIAVREAINKGWIEGPRLVCCGKILTMTSGTTRLLRGMYEEADGADEIQKAARKQFAQGAQFIKLLATGCVYSSEYESPWASQLRAEEIGAAVAVASDNLTYVAAHAHSPNGIRNAVEAGCRSIEHTVYGDEAVYRLMAERGTYLVPTVCTTPAMLSDAACVATVPDYIRQRFIEIHDIHIQNIRLAKRLGVKIAMGTDAGTPGNHCGDNMQELEVMVREAGFSPWEAIRSATIEAATLMGMETQLGSIEPGKKADLIVVHKNPFDDISVLRKVDLVMKDGRVVKNELHA